MATFTLPASSRRRAAWAVDSGGFGDDALEEVYDPFRIQIGFLDRTPRGRVATRLAYEHLGIEMLRKLSLF